MALSIATMVQPVALPVSVQRLKSHLRVDWADDDEYLADLIDSARIWLERKLDRALIARTLRATFDLPIADDAIGPVGGHVGLPPSLAFVLPYQPLYPDSTGVTVAEIEQDIELWHAMTLAAPGQAGDYLVDADNTPPRVWLHSSALSVWLPSWDWTGARTPRVRITYAAGYGTTPATIPMPLRQCVMQAAAYLYENRESSVPPDSCLPTEFIQWRL